MDNKLILHRLGIATRLTGLQPPGYKKWNQEMRFEGLLKTWNDERGFGFIQPTNGGQEIFVHIKSFPAGYGRPALNVKLRLKLNRQLKAKSGQRTSTWFDQRGQALARTTGRQLSGESRAFLPWLSLPCST